jgi:hypothetical protein
MKKLTMISITVRGVRHTRFVYARYDRSGRASMSTGAFDRLLADVGAGSGVTISFG